jgi:hypothetical protein
LIATISATAAGNANQYFFNAHQDTQGNIQFTVKELEELKNPGRTRVQLYPIVDASASTDEVKHAFKTQRQVVINQPTIPIWKGILLIAQHLEHPVQFSAVLHEHTNFLKSTLFDPAIILNKHYLNVAGILFNNVIHPSSNVLAHHLCLRSMVDAGLADGTRPDSIHFMTVDTAIQRDGRVVFITQSFTLSQGQHTVARPASNLHITNSYVGEDPWL